MLRRSPVRQLVWAAAPIGVETAVIQLTLSESIMADITIGTLAINERDGLFSLNDLHLAAGGEAKHQPALFLRLHQTQALIAEISSSTDSQSLAIKTVIGKGKPQGTYACRELVIAYAAWIRPAFHLKVIRAFLAVNGVSEQTPLPVSVDLSVPGPGRYLVHIDNDGQATVKSLKGKSVVDSDGAWKLHADMDNVCGALKELASRIRIFSGSVDLSAVERPLRVTLSEGVTATEHVPPELICSCVGRVQ